MNKLLRCKTPALDDKQGYLVMKNAGTMDLFELLEALDAGIITLNVKEKLQLTYTIIKAVIGQSHNLNLIHTDLKPENFMVDPETMNIILIDYAFATPVDQPRTDKSIHGTKEYLAPEIMCDNSITIKSDSFALGLTIAQIWGYLFNLNITPFTSFDQLYEFHSTRTWTHLFEKMPLSALTKDKITKILDALTEFDPAKRIMPADALIQWEHLLNEFDQIEACHDDHQDSVKPPQLKQSLFTRSPAFFH
ncbi:TPA: protein kinase [Legionella pneumophila subsp. pneumophila]|nr:protein kinase [Legionella pneumophila subsp. pneumophila]